MEELPVALPPTARGNGSGSGRAPRGLGEWMAAVEAIGQLRRITEEVDRNNACMEHRYLKSFSARTKLRRSVYERVAARWRHLGLDGTPPTLWALEDQ